MHGNRFIAPSRLNTVLLLSGLEESVSRYKRSVPSVNSPQHHRQQPLMYSDSLEKSSANYRANSALKIARYAEQDRKGTQAAAVDLAYVVDLGDLDLRDPRVSMAPWDLKDQSG